MFKNYFITAWRNLLRNKVFTLLNVAGLAIGVTVCMFMNVWLQRELSFDTFHPNGDAIFRISNTFKSESESFSQAPSGPAFGAQLPKLLPSLRSACRVFSYSGKFKSDGDLFIEQNVQLVDSNFFNFFGFKLIKGNAFQCLSSPDNIVLTEHIAKKYFGNNDPIGKTLLMDDKYPFTVSAVAHDAPPNSQLQFDMLLPVSYYRKRMMDDYKFDMDNLWVGGWPLVYVQLTDPANWKKTENNINRIAAKYSEKEWKDNKMSYHYFLQPIKDIHLRSNLRYDTPNNGSLARVNIFTVVGIIVLLLACINYINLTTAGAIKRAKETSVRKVIGARKKQLVKQFFVETLIIAAFAVIAGVVLFKLLLPSFSQWLGQVYSFNLGIKNILLIPGFIVLIAIIAGIYPASILSSFKPALVLKGNFAHSLKGNFIRKILVVMQFSITIALVASLIIISKQMNFISNKSLGFDSNAVISINFYGDNNVSSKYGAIRNEFLSSPYILNVSQHDANVVGGLGNGWTTTQDINGNEISTSLYAMGVDADYFDTYGMKLAAGRFFSKDFPGDTTKAVIVNEAAVRTFGWKTPENAKGKRFDTGVNAQYVIGVVKDFNFEALHKPVEALRITYVRRGSQMSLKIDAKHIDAALDHIKKTWKTMVPDVPLEYAFVDDSIKEQYNNEQKMQGVFYTFAALSLIIACLGLFGLSIFVVERKIKEIGIRKVLGANVPGIVVLLSKDFAALVAVAIIIATPLSWYFMNNWLNDFAYRINIEWWVFVLAGAIAMLIALMTISIKSVHAAMANPVNALRSE
jgi:putative ABC transport system permease protein